MSPKRESRRALLLATGRWHPAYFPSVCADCGRPFSVGTAVRPAEPVIEEVSTTLVKATLGWVAECCGLTP